MLAFYEFKLFDKCCAVYNCFTYCCSCCSCVSSLKRSFSSSSKVKYFVYKLFKCTQMSILVRFAGIIQLHRKIILERPDSSFKNEISSVKNIPPRREEIIFICNQKCFFNEKYHLNGILSSDLIKQFLAVKSTSDKSNFEGLGQTLTIYQKINV